MIAPEVVAEIRRMLIEGIVSQREMAKRTGVSRGTIGAVASGQRPDYDAARKPNEDSWETSSDPPERCATCGGMVYMPCLLCRLRKKLVEERNRRARNRAADVALWLVLELRPEHQSRYEEIREKRRQERQERSTTIIP